MQDEPQTIIPGVTHRMPEPEDLMSSMDRPDWKYIRARLYIAAKFGSIRVALTEIQLGAIFALYQGAATYEELAWSIKDFDNGS